MSELNIVQHNFILFTLERPLSVERNKSWCAYVAARDNLIFEKVYERFMKNMRVPKN